MVIDAATGEPIRKALVQLQTTQQRTTFTDGDGRFQFDGIPAGQVSLTAQKPGYFGEQEMRSRIPNQVEVGPRTASIVLKLTPQGVIAGKVMTTSGIPLEHIPLSLTYLNVREGRRRWEERGMTISADDGGFRFASLLPGTYYLSAGPLTPQVETVFEIPAESKTGYPGVYYPGVPDLASASPIVVSAGQQAQANFSLNEVPVYRVSGTISGYAPNQGVGIQLCNQSGTQLSVGVQFSPDNGRFDVRGLPAGVYVLKTFSQSGPNQPVRAEARLNVASNLFNLHLALAPAISISVSVHTEPVAQSGPGAMAPARLLSSGPPLAVRLIGNQPGIGESYATLEDPLGQQTLMLRNMEPGKYSVELMPQGPWYVHSAEYGQTNLLTDDLTLAAEAPLSAIRVVLRNDVASLTGTVKPWDGANNPATIVVVPERAIKQSPKTALYFAPADPNAANDAAFVIDSLAPGDYLAFAFDHAEGIEYSNPDVMQNYISQAAHVTLAPGQRAKVFLDLIRTGEASN